MKQVVFAVLLMAMASLTGCLNGDDSSVDDKTDDTTSDTTEDNSDTKDDELIDPVVNSNVTSDCDCLTEIEILLDSINEQLSELENIATALEISNEQMENSYYQPEEQSSVSIAGIEISKNGKSITVDCSDGATDIANGSLVLLEIYTNNQILITAESNHGSGALYGCYQSSKELELKRNPVIACISYFHDSTVIENYHDTDGDDTRPLAETMKTCNTF